MEVDNTIVEDLGDKLVENDRDQGDKENVALSKTCKQKGEPKIDLLTSESRVNEGTKKRSVLYKNKMFKSPELSDSEVFIRKLFSLREIISREMFSADLHWSLFNAACHSYRYDSVLKPYPPYFIKDCEKNIEDLRSVAESCPNLSVLLHQLKDNNSINTQLLDLIHYVLVKNGEPTLTLVPKEEHSNVMSLVDSKTMSAPPNYIFKVSYNSSSSSEAKFTENAYKYLTKYAFHGSRLENFYSILRHGLQISMNKVSAFGPGIYLSSELSVSLTYSPTGFAWGGSVFGGEMSIVSLCQMIDHPDVKCQDKTGSRSKRAFADGGQSGPVPLKYFIVQNSDLVRVRYLLLYCKDNKLEKSSSTPITWIKKHKFLLVVLGYALFLMSVGLKNSPVGRRLFYQFTRRLGL